MADSGATDSDGARCVWEAGAVLGEGPVWDARTGALWWVDIKGPAIHRLMLGDDPHACGDRRSWTPPFRVSALAPRSRSGLIAATERGFAHVDPEAASYELLHDPESDRPGNRSNDGKVDGRGRFWAGTMDDAEEAASGALYRLDPDLRTTRVDDGYKVTNGPAFGPDGRVMYHTDSATQTVYAFDLADDGAASGRRVHLQFGEGDGYPDGMTVDADGCLWIAFWDGWCIRRFAPDGTRLAERRVPVPRPTSVAFAGPKLDRMFVTSASIGLSRAEHPLAGGLFEIPAPDATGVAVPLFEG